jgi:hypothetical protein
MHEPPLRRIHMLLTIAAVLAIAWLLGFTVFNVASGFIHLLVIVAAVVLVLHFVQNTRTRRRSVM